MGGSDANDVRRSSSLVASAVPFLGDTIRTGSTTIVRRVPLSALGVLGVVGVAGACSGVGVGGIIGVGVVGTVGIVGVDDVTRGVGG